MSLSIFLKFVVLAAVVAVANAWNDIAMDATGKYMVAAKSGEPLYLSDDYGVTWVASKSPVYAWQTVYSDSSGKMLVAASTCTSYCPPLMVSKDRGETWTSAAGIPAANFYYDITGSDDGLNLWTYANSQLYHSHNSGLMWYSVTLPYLYGPNNCGDGVATSDDSAVVHSVSEGYICTSKDSGATWLKHSFKDTHANTWKSFAADSTGQYLFALAYYAVYYSTDYGSTYNLVKEYTNSVDGQFKSLATDSRASVAYIIDNSRLNMFNRSTGAYTPIADLSGVTIITVAVSPSGQYVAAGSSGDDMYVSHDYGASWSKY